MLSVVVFLPLAVALVLLWPGVPVRLVRWVWLAVTVLELALVVGLWIGYQRGTGYAYETDVAWIPSVGVRYHVGVDGISLPLVALTAVLFVAAAAYSLGEQRRMRGYAALFLFLQTVCTGLFVALDLILFFLFFDLSIVGMYFVIAGWGHGTGGGGRSSSQRAALMFFLYTFLGSLALLLGFIGLYLSAEPHTFDMVELTARPELTGAGGALALLAIGVGFAVKTPTVPFHTWLPPAHTEAPAAGSAILAGVLLKMGTYGFLRIAMPMLPDTWRDYALVVVVVGVVSVLYGALVALAQTDVKRMIAYTSVNHMGYVILALGAAGVVAADDDARALATTGAVTQMVSHGLITGALFLLSGVLLDRCGSYQMGEYGGLAGPAPRFAGHLALAAFASLGLPGLAGFVAEFQIFAGAFGARPVATALAVVGVLLTAGLFLRMMQRVLLGPIRTPGGRPFTDLRRRELVSVAPLLALVVVVGVAPRFLLDVIEPAARLAVDLVSR